MTTSLTIPILLNVSTNAGYSVEWMMPGTGGTVMQLSNPRGTHYLLFSMLAPYSADWITMGVLAPHRFGLRGPAPTFAAFVPVVHAFITALYGTDPAKASRYPAIPYTRDPNENYRRAAATQSGPPILGRLGCLRPSLRRSRECPRRRGRGRHRLLGRAPRWNVRTPTAREPRLRGSPDERMTELAAQQIG
jgi:hypothetical protein